MITQTMSPALSTLIATGFVIAVLVLLLWYVILPVLRAILRKLRGKKQLPDEQGIQFNFKNEPRVKSVLIQANEAYAEMKPVEAVSGEFLYDPYDKQRKKEKKDLIYTGLPAYPISISSAIFPTRVSRALYAILFPFGFRIRAYLRLYNEPCTRHMFTGELLTPIKKRNTLIEKKVIDKDGFFLDTNGQRKVINGCWIKPDFSDVDFIKSEFHAYKQSEAVINAAKAMAKTGQVFDKWFFYVLLGAFATVVLTVLMLSGIIQR